MILLGIDPGSRICGYGLIEAQKRVITAVGCDVIDVRNILSLPKRLSAVFDGMESIIESYKPDAAVVESIFYHKNAKSVFTLGQARGVVFLCLGRHDIPVFEYSPREVKKAVSFDVVFSPQINYWNGSSDVQLKIRDAAIVA